MSAISQHKGLRATMGQELPSLATPHLAIEPHPLHQRYTIASQHVSALRAQQRKLAARTIATKIRILTTTQGLQGSSSTRPDAARVIARLAREIGLNSPELVRAVGTMEAIWKKAPDEITWQKSPSNYYRALLAPGLKGKNLPTSIEFVIRVLSKNGMHASNEIIAEAIGRPLAEIRPLLSASLQLLVACGHIQQGAPELTGNKRFAMWEHRNHPIDPINHANHIIALLRCLAQGPMTRKRIAAVIQGDKRSAYLTEMSLRNYEDTLLANRIITKSRSGNGSRATVVYQLTPATAGLIRKYITTEKMPLELRTIITELFTPKTKPPRKRK